MSKAGGIDVSTRVPLTKRAPCTSTSGRTAPGDHFDVPAHTAGTVHTTESTSTSAG